ncbi:MAG: FtsX-like permease family protein [Bacilli bacterium]|jgi:putative ABC transport system permease protein|nr:FtsX-like permease family protein [Bacilli bacterium]MDD2681997.1 FtsX-like permease family protein [Bacilli bacterium]MDD3121153.1 FtsX-like permease family protein [Bacilli bacterium]MDD4063351.1 FtsX-like permease family protein [Bacilli bacterium]MDD4482403.1 FtsX-like permease family protein [Bacilli bacterium]
MKKTYFKMLFRDIKNNLSRFFSIVAIVALAVAFLVGLLSTTPDIRLTMNKYYKDTNTADILLKSDLGFIEEDIIKINNSVDSENIMPFVSFDKILFCNSEKTTSRIQYLPLSFLEENSFIGKLELIDGKLPTTENEVVVERSNNYFVDVKINDKIYDGDKEYTVVGIAGNPWYYVNEKEFSNVGSGTLNLIMYFDISYFDFGYYTDVYITINNGKSFDTYKDDYKELINNEKDKLSILGKDLAIDRLNQVTDQMKDYGVSQQEIDEVTNMWYILDRYSNASFVSLKNSSGKISDIATVFPLFFFLIAALVALSTMTRMIEEERTQIGTLKSLGYSRGSIIFKYLLYSSAACVVGAIIGVFTGFQALPQLIYNTYATMYHLPKLITELNWIYTVFSSLIMFIIILSATLFAGLTTLKANTATLIIQKAPKPGQRIFLEKIPFIWKRLKFNMKSSLRNVFRYKKSLFMVIIGIGGCSALFLTGLGLGDSLSNVTKNQYEEIEKFDLTIGLNTKNPDRELEAFLNDNTIVENYLVVFKTNVILTKNSEYSLGLIVIEDEDKDLLSEFIAIKHGKKDIILDNNSVIITKQLANVSSSKINDIVEIKYGIDNYELKITGIVDNYLNNYIYLTRTKFKEVFGTDLHNSSYIIKLVEEFKGNDSLSEDLLDYDSVNNISFNYQSKELFDNLIDKLSFVVVILIAGAIVLAIIVVYNLTNISITERTKEIATLKVLGYHNREVSKYIYREMIIQSIMGIAFGLVLGKLLHLFVISIANSPGMIFPSVISIYSYLITIASTITIVILVDLVMLYKIVGIKMSDSMKAIE